MSAIDSKIIRLCNRLDVKDAIITLLDSSLKERDDRVSILRNIISDNDKTIVRYTMYEVHLKKELDIKDTIISDLRKGIQEQANAIKDLLNLLADCRTELTRGTR